MQPAASCADGDVYKRQGMADAMNRMNQRPKAPKPKKEPQEKPEETKKEVEA